MALLARPQTIHLTTIGARTGEPRRVELLAQPYGEGAIVIASKAGAPTHPAWFYNLVANPDVTIEVGDRKVRARARVAEPTERDPLWVQTKAAFPGFRDYEEKTERVIPVVVLEPTAAG